MSQDAACDPAILMASPLFRPLAPLLDRFGGEELPTLAQCNALLDARSPPITVQQGIPLRFVAQEYGNKPFERQYEPRCYLTGAVQMRADNTHDIFNALVWMTFPASKASLNARHYNALLASRAASPGKRGAGRDMATLFDESGIIVASADPELSALLQDRQWESLFLHRRENVIRDMEFMIFGHGLYEKSLSPYIGMTGKGLVVTVAREFFTLPLEHKLTRLDHSVADYLNDSRHCQNTRELLPVPLLGIPGWWDGNNCPSFYRNISYFRPSKS